MSFLANSSGSFGFSDACPQPAHTAWIENKKNTHLMTDRNRFEESLHVIHIVYIVMAICPPPPQYLVTRF